MDKYIIDFTKLKMNERIIYIRENFLLCSQLDLANELNVTQPSISRMENNTSNSINTTILLFAEVFNININWLLTGEGRMFALKSDTYLETLRSIYTLDELEYQFIKNFLSLPKSKRILFLSFIDAIK